MNKNKVYKALEIELINRKKQLSLLFDELRQSTESETKSSAGDKHETGKAMVQLEQEKLSKQLFELNKLSETLFQLDPLKTFSKIQHGSLVQTTLGWYYLSIGIGRINIDGVTIFCMTSASPFGKELMGKTLGDKVIMSNKEFDIIEVL